MTAGGARGSFGRTLLFGFERGLQCEDVLGILQGLVDEAVEWVEARSLVTIITDVKQAIDFVRPAVVARRCMQYWAFPPTLAGSVVRESLHLQGSAIVPGVGNSEASQMGARIRQGGVEGPWCFNLVIRTALDMLRSKRSTRGVDAPLIGRINIIGRADNLILVSWSVARLRPCWMKPHRCCIRSGWS